MNHPFGNRSRLRDGVLTIRYKLVPIKHKTFKFEVHKSNDEGDCWVAVPSMGSKRVTLRATSEREGRQKIEEQLKADMAACTRLGFVHELNKGAWFLTIRGGERLS